MRILLYLGVFIDYNLYGFVALELEGGLVMVIVYISSLSSWYLYLTLGSRSPTDFATKINSPSSSVYASQI